MNVDDKYYTATCDKCGKKLYSKYDTVYFATGPRYSYASLCEDCYIKITGHNPNKPSLWLKVKGFFKKLFR